MSITLSTEENIRDTVDSLGEVIKYLKRIRIDVSADPAMTSLVESLQENASSSRTKLRELQDRIKTTH